MTLIEIMVVITILGLIASAIGISVVGQMKEARRKTATLDLHNIDSALRLYYTQTRHYPEASEGIAALVAAHQIDRVPSDPWGNAYAYERPGSSHYILKSYGADGQPGGEGDDADIVVESAGGGDVATR